MLSHRASSCHAAEAPGIPDLIRPRSATPRFLHSYRRSPPPRGTQSSNPTDLLASRDGVADADRILRSDGVPRLQRCRLRGVVSRKANLASLACGRRVPGGAHPSIPLDRSRLSPNIVMKQTTPGALASRASRTRRLWAGGAMQRARGCCLLRGRWADWGRRAELTTVGVAWVYRAGSCASLAIPRRSSRSAADRIAPSHPARSGCAVIATGSALASPAR